MPALWLGLTIPLEPNSCKEISSQLYWDTLQWTLGESRSAENSS